jgi:hypothetical protein
MRSWCGDQGLAPADREWYGAAVNELCTAVLDQIGQENDGSAHVPGEAATTNVIGWLFDTATAVHAGSDARDHDKRQGSSGNDALGDDLGDPHAGDDGAGDAGAGDGTASVGSAGAAPLLAAVCKAGYDALAGVLECSVLDEREGGSREPASDPDAQAPKGQDARVDGGVCGTQAAGLRDQMDQPDHLDQPDQRDQLDQLDQRDQRDQQDQQDQQDRAVAPQGSDCGLECASALECAIATALEYATALE